jgi:hypothetical protein
MVFRRLVVAFKPEEKLMPTQGAVLTLESFRPRTATQYDVACPTNCSVEQIAGLTNRNHRKFQCQFGGVQSSLPICAGVVLTGIVKGGIDLVGEDIICENQGPEPRNVVQDDCLPIPWKPVLSTTKTGLLK